MTRIGRSRGGVNPAAALLAGSAAAVVALAVLLTLGQRRPSNDITPTADQPPLVVYCAGGLKAPLEAIAADYQRAIGQPIQLQFGGSNTLLTNLKVSGQGDVFLPADDSYIEMAKRDRLVNETVPVARMRAIVAVPKGNPRGIRALADLLSGRVKISMTEPDAAATGKLVREALEKTGQWDAFRQRVTVFKPTVNDVASDLKLGAVDAGVIWDAMLAAYPDFEALPLKELAAAEARVVAGVAAASRQHAAALAFARFLAAPGQGAIRFQENGFTPVAAAANLAEERR